MSDDTLYNYWKSISRRVENSYPIGIDAKCPAIPETYHASTISVGWLYLHLAKPSRLFVIATLTSRRASNIASGDLYPGGVHNADREMLGIIGEKIVICCNLFGKYWLVSLSVVPVVLSVVVVNIEQVPASFHSTESTEPIVIENADERTERCIWKDRASCRLGSPKWLPTFNRYGKWHRHSHALHRYASPW